MAVLSGVWVGLGLLYNCVLPYSPDYKGMFPGECCSPGPVGSCLRSRCTKETKSRNPKGYNELQLKSVCKQYLKDGITLSMDF